MRSFYELNAETKDYYYFDKKHIDFEEAHFHSSIELLIVLKGKVEVSIDGEKRIIGPKQGVFVDSFNVHAYRCSNDSLIYVLVGNKKYFNDFFSFTNNKKPATYFDFSQLEKIEILFDEFKRINENKEIYFLGIVNILLSYIIQDNCLMDRKKNDDSSLICKVLKYVDEHYEEALTIEKISKEFGYSKEHFSRVLHKYLNENWNSYLNRKRLVMFERKRKENPNKNILDLAYEVGFSSQSTFYRAYKKEYNNLIKEK